MKNKLLLSLAITTLTGLPGTFAFAAEADAVHAPQQAVKQETAHGGKCASGKCGTVKAYEKAATRVDPQDKLVRARDGKCGLSADGLDATPQSIATDKMASGVCGQ